MGEGAAVFKTLNQTGAENMADAGRFETKPAMFVAGDDATKKPTLMQLIRDLAFEGSMPGRFITRGCWSRWRWSGSIRR
jgi:predicted dinucleotide-binding enzyme